MKCWSGMYLNVNDKLLYELVLAKPDEMLNYYVVEFAW